MNSFENFLIHFHGAYADNCFTVMNDLTFKCGDLFKGLLNDLSLGKMNRSLFFHYNFLSFFFYSEDS